MLSTLFCVAQTTLYNNGLVSIMPGAVVQVNGNVEVESTWINYGDVTVSNSNNQADFQINTNGSVQGDGTTYLEGDWINDGQFFAQASTIELNGVNQEIAGSAISVFNNLSLENQGVKTMMGDAYVNNILSLDSSELATQNFTMFVNNPAPSAVITAALNPADRGFVSSLANGSLWWQTGQAGTYMYPVGSSQNSVRYRPIALELPAGGTGNEAYNIRMVDNLATDDGFDVTKTADSLCALNRSYYHEIHEASGNSVVGITQYFNSAQDGSFDAIGIWNTPQTNNWNKAGAAVLSASGTSNFNTLTISNWSDFSEYAFVLGQLSPEGPVIMGSPSICNGQVASYTLTPNNSNSSNFNWSVSEFDATLESSLQGSTSMEVYWGNNAGSLTATEVYPNGCVSLPSAPFAVSISQGPTASFASANNSTQVDVVDFTDNSSSAFGWEWDFGDDVISTDQNPSHEYDEIGTYTVMLVAEDEFGCVDTVYSDVTVGENVILPIVFSPNGDGINDVFVGSSVGTVNYDLTIYNRWGEIVFESEATKAEWTGHTFGGQECLPGTYFYTLTASGVSGEDYSRNGYVTLVR
ncbi:gliding motility-associated C-terminal domain-containing protein [Flavobacteriales bacterium]|nr:gliding motility-associated C-terminal domain-containing protein [Flavobacteriales bacterium]